jgi:hypothetical protein
LQKGHASPFLSCAFILENKDDCEKNKRSPLAWMLRNNAIRALQNHFRCKSVGNTLLLFGRLMQSSILNGAIVAAESAAERLQALVQSELAPRVLAEISQAKHDIGNSLQCLVYLNQELIRLQTERDNLLKQVEGATNDTKVTPSRKNRA